MIRGLLGYALRRLRCRALGKHPWEEFTVARRCLACGKIEVNRNALS